MCALHAVFGMSAGTSKQKSLPTVSETTLYTLSPPIALGSNIFVWPPLSLPLLPEAQTRPLMLWRLVTTARMEEGLEAKEAGRGVG